MKIKQLSKTEEKKKSTQTNPLLLHSKFNCVGFFFFFFLQYLVLSNAHSWKTTQHHRTKTIAVHFMESWKSYMIYFKFSDNLSGETV